MNEHNDNSPNRRGSYKRYLRDSDVPVPESTIRSRRQRELEPLQQDTDMDIEHVVNRPASDTSSASTGSSSSTGSDRQSVYDVGDNDDASNWENEFEDDAQFFDPADNAMIDLVERDEQIRKLFEAVTYSSYKDQVQCYYPRNRVQSECHGEWQGIIRVSRGSRRRVVERVVYKYICIKINLAVREIHLDLQEEFLIQLIRGMFPKKTETKHSIASRLKSDLSNFYVPLPGASDKVPDTKRKTVLEYLHISPMKLHVKLLASAEAQTSNFDPTYYCGLVRSIFEYACKGTFLKSAEFRLPYFEKCGITMDNRELLLELWQSYSAEMRHQFNVLILSMTVLGNPYSYNFKSPGNYFYDPDAIVIQGDETAERLSYDVSCLLGYTSMDGQSASILDFNITDLDATRIKKKVSRFESTETPESVITVDCSFSIGVELEISGLIIKPTDNTHQEELRYSLKTLGKGILGLTQRDGQKNSLKIQPGLILDTIKRAQEMGYNFVSRIRFPRYINPYLAVELYSTYKARGMHLLNTVRKSDYINGETYWAHAALSNDGRHIALISLQRIHMIEKRCIWGSWTVAWSVEMKDLVEAPTVEGNKLILNVNKNKSMSPPSPDWYLESKDATTLEWLCRKINTAMILNMESISVSPRFGV